jgi:Icc-related predicted phosphoesterase
MRFLTVADEIVPSVYSLNIKERFGQVACVLGCGDLPYYYLEFIVTTLAVPCYYVLGNHDRTETTEGGEELSAPRGCVSLEQRSERVGGLILAGLGGCVRYNSEEGPQYTESEMLMHAWSLAPHLVLNRLRYGRYLDILLTHAPPLGIHNGPDRPHRGFHTFLALMDRFRPRYLVHGHIHRSYGFSPVTATRYRDTLVLNTAGHRVLEVESLPVAR